MHDRSEALHSTNVVRSLAVALALAGCLGPAPRRDDVRAEVAAPAGSAAAVVAAPAGSAAAEVTAPAGSAAVAVAEGRASPAAAADARAAAAADGWAGAPANAPADTPVLAVTDAPTLAIVDAPIAWSDERERLTLDYRRAHSDAQASDLIIDPRVIVLHYTGGHSAKATRAYFDRVKIEASREQLARGGAVNVSAHFLVDRDGTIYRLQPETRFARHCIGLNHVAIGIENVGDGKQYPLTDAQVAADAALVRDLARRFRITHLLGHHEVMRLRDHPYYVERDPTYKNEKGDPGDAFMARVRERVADLGLAGL
jgi:N-acetylmuramoyl-L-alanine amidase